MSVVSDLRSSQRCPPPLHTRHYSANTDGCSASRRRIQTDEESGCSDESGCSSVGACACAVPARAVCCMLAGPLLPTPPSLAGCAMSVVPCLSAARKGCRRAGTDRMGARRRPFSTARGAHRHSPNQQHNNQYNERDGVTGPYISTSSTSESNHCSLHIAATPPPGRFGLIFEASTLQHGNALDERENSSA